MFLVTLPIRRYPLSWALAATLLLTACSASPAVNASTAGGANPTGTSANTAPDITVTPADHAAAVPLDTLLTVQAANGTLDSVVVSEGAAGAPVSGTLNPGNHAWRASASLDPSSTYTVSASAISPAGNASTARTTFTTVAANRLTTAATPGDGDVVGIGMPIILHFNTDIPAGDQLDVVNHIAVTSTPATVGAWHWFAPDEVHWRPEAYWQTGTTVTVTANLKGVGVGGGTWGLGNWNETFTIGASHISYIDGNTHMMTVTSNGQKLYTWPASLGRADLPTIGGTLYVHYKQQTVLMDSATIGIPRDSPDGYYENVFEDVAISTDGFFIHSAPWSVAQQGSSNVSHGCVNLSPAHATTFFNFSQPGDVVIATNTGREANAGDGEGDWQIPFAQFANSGGTVIPPPSAAPGGV